MTEKSQYLRIPITMPADMVAYLEDLSLKAKVTGGRKLANTEITRAAIRLFVDLEVDSSGCKGEEDLLLAAKRSMIERTT